MLCCYGVSLVGVKLNHPSTQWHGCTRYSSVACLNYSDTLGYIPCVDFTSLSKATIQTCHQALSCATLLRSNRWLFVTSSILCHTIECHFIFSLFVSPHFDLVWFSNDTFAGVTLVQAQSATHNSFYSTRHIESLDTCIKH